MSEKTFLVKFRLIKTPWSGWPGKKPEPAETTIEEPSGSKLILEEGKYSGIFGWNPKVTGSYKQTEAYQIYVSPKLKDQVELIPKITLEPIEGKEFPVYDHLHLKRTALKRGESVTVETTTMDAGVKYEITLLEIVEK